MSELKLIPNVPEFKEKFVERYSKLTNWEEYKKFTTSFLRKSIRINTLKKPVKEVVARLENDWHLEQIPWCEEGFYIESKHGRLDVGNTIEHCLGYYYVQEAASMIPPIVLGPKPGERVLDMAAAPGSKASQIAQMMKNEGILVANDVAGIRLAALGINLQRCGVLNAIITQMKGEEMRDMEFDKILLDAPCSGTGTIRKSIKTILMWNPEMIKRLAATQRKMIIAAYRLLAKGGTLVYSTCSTEPEEDEAVISYLLDNTDARVVPIELNIRRSPAVLEFEGREYRKEVKDCLRIWPQDNDTEGFFVAKITRP
ncbi:MAG: RsmB/NOP family class I SAM-dependent RNA methyltransferase [Candidatus Woesearchaeota archaeon]